jgi:hypothetical protein
LRKRQPPPQSSRSQVRLAGHERHACHRAKREKGNCEWRPLDHSINI